jgi:hypothetical protein
MNCVFLRVQVVAALTVAGITSASLPAQTTTSTRPNSGPPTRFPLVRDGKWGLIDGNGSVVVGSQFDEAVEPRFDRIYRFEQGLGNATLDGRMGYIDGTGTWVIEPHRSF